MRYNKNEKKAYDKGYRISDDGVVIGKTGNEVGSLRSNGYYQFKIRDLDGKNINVPFHRLQAYQKFGDKIYEDGIVVRHLDGDSSNNSIDNIDIGSYSDNYMDQPKEVRVSRALHASSFMRKYDKEEVKEFYDQCISYQKTMEKFGIGSKGTLHYILNS